MNSAREGRYHVYLNPRISKRHREFIASSDIFSVARSLAIAASVGREERVTIVDTRSGTEYDYGMFVLGVRH